MPGRQLDLLELKDMNLFPHFVTEKYYVARGPQLTNRVVDISSVLNFKRNAIALHVIPINNMWRIYLEKHPEGTGRLKLKKNLLK